jgi:ABC-type enterochelin transport system permease subunit
MSVVVAKFPPVALVLFSVITAVVGVFVGTPLSYVGTLVAGLAMILAAKADRAEMQLEMDRSHLILEDGRRVVGSTIVKF